jgi:hypothetical protein
MKRSASLSPHEEPPVKKQKANNDPAEDHNGVDVSAPPPTQVTTVGLETTAEDEIHETRGKGSLDDVQMNRQKEKTTRKAGEGFTAWKPKPAYVPIPPVQPHWGIVPRSGAHRPTEVQPPARDSDAAVRPALWEDRKGAVRVKRGTRYIDGYDQAFHMWLPLMDLRPTSKKNQAPKRIAVGYYYRHGMPTDWNDPGPLNDLNKALQNAIKDRAYEKPWTNAERNALAQLFVADPQASMWDIAERFNDQIYPVEQNNEEEDQYPTGRFIEGIRHEYLTYKSTYDKGEAPTEHTSTDTPLEVVWAAKKAAAPKKATASGTKKATMKSATAKMSDSAGVTRKKRASKKQSKQSDAMIVESDDEAQQPQQPQQQPSVLISQQPRLSDDDEIMLEIAGAYDPDNARASSPLSPHTHAMITSPSYGSTIAATTPDEHIKVSQTTASSERSCTTSILPNSPPAKDSSFEATAIARVSADIRVTQESAVEQIQEIYVVPSEAPKQALDAPTGQETETSIIASTTPQAEIAQPAAAAVEVADVPQPSASTADATVSEFVGKAIREVQIDENYDDDDDDELDSLFNE